MTEQNEIILKEREAQYGSFELNLKLIKKLSISKFIKLNVGLKSAPNDIHILDRAANDFSIVRYMLALKTVRSITASDSAYIDCFIDFQNYIKLFIDIYKEYMPDIEIVFNKDFFRFESHQYFLDANDSKSGFNIIKSTVKNVIDNIYIIALNDMPHNLKLKQEIALNLLKLYK